MGVLRFTDGVTVNTNGKFRILELADGYYVVGHGYMEPVSSYEEAQEVLHELQEHEQEVTK